MIKNRQIQVIDNDRGIHMRPMPGMIGLISSTSKDKKKTQPVKQSDMKRTRRDRGTGGYRVQLVQETDQPAVCLLAVCLRLAKCYTQILQLHTILEEILNELCVYKKRNNQGTYELKPEYKKSVEDTAE
ncbi:transcription initiation factor IIF subunit beta [Prunus yedoensis var. nudiflora]|uniref:Transcription initiation factor IIF subunit beta n=1 Tax=Prunus yedoensis var. nudiflora TaxID=2094558 RepID=A0A314ZPE1_PRUYE|nr:transcription initiation factor IIF subunit beta [Prunus yedoensis var. nudiflora]